MTHETRMARLRLRQAAETGNAERAMDEGRRRWGRYHAKTRSIEIRGYGPQCVSSCELVEAYARVWGEP
jgi:hypothetical protein